MHKVQFAWIHIRMHINLCLWNMCYSVWMGFVCVPVCMWPYILDIVYSILYFITPSCRPFIIGKIMRKSWTQ